MEKIVDLANDPGIKSLYETDEHQWLLNQVALLEDGKLSELDKANLTEYLSEMASRDRRELRSRMVVLVMHIMKWEVQPKRRSRSWRHSIVEAQLQINLLLKDLPSLKRFVPQLFVEACNLAASKAANETDIPLNQFSPTKYTFEGVMHFKV